MGACAFFPIDCGHKLVEQVGICLVLPEVDDVNVHFLLLQLLGQLDHLLLVSLDGRANKSHNSRLVVLSLPVLQRQVGDFDARDEPDVTSGRHLV